jgi:hypothetical protein
MLLFLAALAAPHAAPDRATLCVFRPAQNGRLNVDPVWLSVRSKATGARRSLSFSEGVRTRCASLPAGRTAVTLRFIYPYGGAYEPEVSWSISAVVQLPQGRNYWVLDVPTGWDTTAPGWDKTGWHWTWSLWRVPHRLYRDWWPTTMRLRTNRGGVLILGRP